MTTALDDFFDHYYRRRPVNATFTGVHHVDSLLPDWSPAGLARLDDEMRDLEARLADTPIPGPLAGPRVRAAVTLDTELARDFLAIHLAENGGGHGVRANPALWTGEAIFSVVGLMIREFAPRSDRLVSAAARLDAIPDFLADARRTLGDREIPASWTAKAIRECEGGSILFTSGVDRWIAAGREAAQATRLRAAADRADAALRDFARWLGDRPRAPHEAVSCGAGLYDLLLTRGHHCTRSRADLLRDAKSRFDEEQARLGEIAARAAGSWPAAQEGIAADHPDAESYLASFASVWDAARDVAVSNDVVTWPDWPVRYVTYPFWTRDAAPYLYYLHYRSPGPFDRYDVHDYVVPEVPLGAEEQHLRTWNTATIKLNHVVHHGGIGHHVQNWFAYHLATSRIGQIAAVDCASRIGMFCGGTMAEGWACYVTGLMDELGFLTPLEQVADQHSRVRFLARAIVDIELHQGGMSFDDAVRFYTDRVGMRPEAARGEAVKNSMFPCTAIVYWLGTQAIRDLRAQLERQRGARFSLKTFHDQLLMHGSIPVPLIERLLLEDDPATTPALSHRWTP